jgi:hypothetical protein
MKASDIATALGFETAVPTGAEVTGAYASDLLSDVLANAAPGSLLITIQAHRNAVAVAGVKDLAAIVLCGGRRPDEDTLAAARDEGIGIYLTPRAQFETAGRLWSLLGGGRATAP